MAKTEEIKVVVDVVAKGLKEVTKQLKEMNKAQRANQSTRAEGASSFEKTNRLLKDHSKGMKGVAGATTNSTKAFSKMEQGMVGGLVPAYAVVAANIFALTAAFGALSRAADFEVMIRGAKTLEAQTGRSLTNLASGMQEITNGAISMKEALRSASIAASAGFDNTTIKELTEVARNASIALGRDMTDAMNRVFKGAIKAEPELLDELGIILRLEPATRKYAASINKAVKDLTTFEKQQAVVNAVLEQGQKKFDKLSDVDINPYSKLSASFSILIQNILEFINLGFGPIIGALADNVELLAASFLIFAGVLLKNIIPSLANMGESLTKSVKLQQIQSKSLAVGARAFREYSDAIREAKDDSVAFGIVAKSNVEVIKNAAANIEGQIDPEAFARISAPLFTAKPADIKLTNTLQAIEEEITFTQEAMASSTGKASKAFEKQNAALLELHAATSAEIFELETLNNTQNRTVLATSRLSQAMRELRASIATVKLGALQGFAAGYQEGLFNIIKNLRIFTKEQLTAAAGTKLFGIATRTAAQGVFILGAALGSLLKAIPIIGQLIFAFSLLTQGFKAISGFFRDNDAIDNYTEKMEGVTEASESARFSTEFFEASLNTLAPTLDNLNAKLTHQRNVLLELTEARKDLADSLVSVQDFTTPQEFLDFFGLGDISEQRDNIVQDLKSLRKEGFGAEASLLEVLIGDPDDLKTVEQFKDANKEIEKAMRRLLGTTNKAFDANVKIGESFDALSKKLRAVSGALPKLNELEEVMLEINDILADMTSQDPLVFLSTLANLSKGEAFQLGLSDIKGEIDLLSDDMENAGDKITELNSEFLNSKTRIKELSPELVSLANSITDGSQAYEDMDSLLKKASEGSRDLARELHISTAESVIQTKAFLDQAVALHIYNQAMKDAEKQAVDLAERARVALEKTNKSLLATVNALQSFNAEAGKVKLGELFIFPDLTAQLERTNKLRDLEIQKIQTANKESRNALGGLTGTLEEEEIKTKRQLELKLEKDSEKIKQLNIKGLVNINKLLTKNIANEVKGLSTHIDTNDLLIQRSELMDKIIAQQGLSGDAAEKVRQESEQSLRIAIAVAEANDKIRTTQAQTVDRSRGLEDTIKSYGVEQAFLKENNSLIEDRVDRQLLLSQAVNEEAIRQTDIALRNKDIIADEKEFERLARLRLQLSMENKLIEDARAAVIKKQFDSNIASSQIELASKAAELKIGRQLTAAEKRSLDLQKEKDKLAKQGFTVEQLKEQLAILDEIDKLKFEIDFNLKIDDALPSIVSDLTQIFAELAEEIERLNTPIEKMNAGIIAGIGISEQFGDENGKAFGQMALSVGKFIEDFKDANGNIEKIADAAGSALVGVGAAIQEAAGDNEDAARAGAVIQGIGAVIKAWNSAPFPYNVPAIAATIAGVSSLLSQIGESANLGSAQAGQEAAQEQFQSQFGAQGVSGVNMQTNALVDSLDQLIEIDSDLFSALRDLQVSVTKLDKSFRVAGGATFSKAGDFGEVNLLELFNFKEFTDLDPGFFGDTTTTAGLLGSGLELGATIEFIGSSLKGTLEDVNLFLTQIVTETSSGFLGFGGGTDTTIISQAKDVGNKLSAALNGAFTSTLEVLSGLFATVGNSTADLEALFQGAPDITIDTTKLDLVGKTAAEQGEVIAAFFSNLSNEIVDNILPWVSDFTQAGEELTDTLVRLTSQSVVLNNALKDIDFSFDDLTGTIDDNILQMAFENALPVLSEAQLNDVAAKQERIAQLQNKIAKGPALGYGKAYVNFWQKMIDELEVGLDGIIGDTRGNLESFKLQIITAWQDALIGKFISIDEFNTIFEKFSETLFSETELATIALENTRESLANGIQLLTEQLESAGLSELAAALSEDIGSVDFRTFVDAATAIGAFEVSVDELTGTIDTSGADLFGTVIQVGASIGIVDDALEELNDLLDDFNAGIQRQIDLFGLVGKELALLQLDFELEDTLQDAREAGGDIALVEQLFGLKRLEIIKEFNQEIVDQLETAFNSVSDAMLGIVKSFDSWNDVLFTGLKVDKMFTRLADSLGDAGNIDFSAFTENLVDMQDALNFEELFGDLVTFSEEVPDNITDQIALVEDLKQAVIERYNVEAAALEDIKTLSIDIQGFLRDLQFSDVSPLTNAEQLEAAIIRFDTNAVDIFSTDAALSSAASADLLDSADLLLNLASDFFAIGPDFQAIFNDVTSKLTSIDEDIVARLGLSDEALATEEQTDILSGLQEQTIGQLQVLEQVLTELEAQNTIALNLEIENLGITITTHLDFITTKLQSLNDSTWVPILNALTNLPGAAHGRGTVDFDQLIQVHKGEMIVPAKSADVLRDNVASNDSVTTNTNNNNNIVDTSEVVNAIRILTAVVADSQEDILDQGERFHITNGPQKISNATLRKRV